MQITLAILNEINIHGLEMKKKLITWTPIISILSVSPFQIV